MKFKIATLGCRNNQYESAEVRASFEKEGFQPVPFDRHADICVINTCSVTEKSNYRCRQIIRKTVDSNPDSLVVVVGCYPQLDRDAVKALPGVDLILGNEEKLDVVKFLKDLNIHERIQNKPEEPVVIIGKSFNKTAFRSEEVNHFAGKTKAFLKIQTGCNFKCSFCVITLARGQSRSADPTTVVRQFKKLLENGFKEITLTGIDLGSYGRDLSLSTNINELLKMLINIEGDFRIRLSSLGPKDINDELINLIATSSKICNHLHISLQSGSDKILRLMKRNYRMKSIYKLIDKITKRPGGRNQIELPLWRINEKTSRKGTLSQRDFTSPKNKFLQSNSISKIPEIGLGADLIAGFPGEGDEEFEETIDVVKEIPFSYLHVFNFSRRKNTVAYNLPDQVPHRVRKERVSILKDLSRQKSLNFKERFIGKDLEVLIEQNRDPVTGLLKGYTRNYLPVLISGTDELMNQIVDVRLSHLENDRLYGVI